MEKAYLSMASNGASKKKGIKKLFGLGLLAGFTALSLSLISGFTTGTKASEVLAGNDESEQLVSNDVLTFSVSTSAATSNSHSFQCQASATKIEALSNSSRLNNVFVIANDSSFPASITEAVDAAKEAQKAAEDAGEEYVAPHYNASVYCVYNATEANSDIVIPSTVNYAGYFVFDVTSIGPEACYDHENLKEISYNNIDSITIPSTIKTIVPNAFIGAKEAGIKFYVQAADSTGFEPGWTDAEDITYSADMSSARSKLNVSAAAGIRLFGESKDFLIGIKREGYDYPLIAQYRLLDSANKQVGDFRKIELPITSTNADYDAVGSNMGSSTKTFVVDIPVPNGLHVDDKSLTFHNVYAAKRVEEPGKGFVIVPDLEEGQYYAVPRFAFEQTATFETLFTNRPGSLNSFGDFTKVGLIVKRELSAYEALLPRAYANYKKEILSGAYSIRHQFTSLAQSTYHITYEVNGSLVTKDVKVSTPITNAIINSTGEYEVGFLINNADVGPGFSADSLKDIDICGFSIKIDLLNNEKNSRVNKSDLTIRFSSLTLIKSGSVEPAAKINVTLTTVMVFVIYAAIYAAVVTAYYFYAKNKYKNDEFRRVDGKKFLKSAIKNGIGLGILVGAIFFIYARWGLFESTVVVYNPIDVFVIIFSIAGLIYAGFAIKNIVTSIKNNRKRKEAARLHLDEDKDEDGTN